MLWTRQSRFHPHLAETNVFGILAIDKGTHEIVHGEAATIVIT